MARCRVDNPPIIWDDIILMGCSNWGSKTLNPYFVVWLWGLLYIIWCTRNEIQHAGHPITEEQILKKILWEVRTRVIGSRKFPKTKENLVLCSLWNLPVDVLC
jgi:hypothetical protein